MSGWDARDQVPNSTTTIHHPSGDEKSISFDFDPPTVTRYIEDDPTAGASHWRIADWDEGTTEGGSSGGCLYDDSSKRCIGTLSGGYAACGNDDPDWYGRTAKQWTGGGTDGTRLSTWLDKANTGAMFLDGKNAEGGRWVNSHVAHSRRGVGARGRSHLLELAGGGGQPDHREPFRLDLLRRQEPGLARGALERPPLGHGQPVALPSTIRWLAEAPASGLIYAVVDGDGTAVSARTWTPAAGGGSYGQGQPGILLSSAVSSTELILPMVHSAPGAFRTNIGFAQTSSGSMQVRVQLYSRTGTLAGPEELLSVGSLAAGE